jgi:hypothetical protein
MENTTENQVVTRDPAPIQDIVPPMPSPLVNLFNRLKNRNKTAKGAFGGKRRNNHVKGWKRPAPVKG